MQSTLISIGPLPNIAAALEREPKIAARTRFVGMHGSVRRNYRGLPGQDAEYNVNTHITAAQKVFTAPWKEIVITPLDTCGVIRLEGERYQKIRQSKDPAVRAVMEAAGVQNCLAKIQGTQNPLANARCAIQALGEMRTFRQLAADREVELSSLY